MSGYRNTRVKHSTVWISSRFIQFSMQKYDLNFEYQNNESISKLRKSLCFSAKAFLIRLIFLFIFHSVFERYKISSFDCPVFW